ncbi:unnamed protein product [Mytilus coruscus]|uniref:Endonuclease/exonuclease/phosphatase domain-containing protein n=1 Tax=Mytilus coruscus TaxID=42192 RepID=A0A6J8CQM8_MYTCO|nr:unnamed protein product [Mytilus coruscus]
MGRHLRNRLDLIKPDINRQVQDKQMKIAIKPAKETIRQFTEGETVAIRDYRGPNKWTSGLVTKREGPLNCQVEVSPNSIWKRHDLSYIIQSTSSYLHQSDDAVSDSIERNITCKYKQLGDIILCGDLNARRKEENSIVSKGELLSNFPFDPIIRGSYYKCYREYNKLRKYKMRTFKQSILNSLDNLRDSDPKQYWKLINSLKESTDDNQ